MENVPRVAKIIELELRPGGRLRRFRHLNITPHVINMQDFGLPQRRSRCIVGNFSCDLLSAYARTTTKRTLGQVIAALAADSVIDPIYGLILERTDLRDHLTEDVLNVEEIRINKANKTMHPVYNAMPFPDRLNRSVRTITATCTRVSRESIVIEEPNKPESYRRLTIRERASLQGFPITFQFYGSTYGQKLKMVGNAFPPVVSYYVAHAFKGTKVKMLPALADRAARLKLPSTLPTDASPDRPGAHYPKNRKFRFAIPSLRLKSGVRFELVNVIDRHRQGWEVNFYFGNSKSIHSLTLDKTVQRRLLQGMSEPIKARANIVLGELADFLSDADIGHMQRIWNHKGLGQTTPFMLLDKLDEFGDRLIEILSFHQSAAEALIAKTVEAEHGNSRKKPAGIAKLLRNAPLILSGLLIGSVANIALGTRDVFLERRRRVST
jgi:DNA (cytosine-5)-methyltransferase 1